MSYQENLEIIQTNVTTHKPKIYHWLSADVDWCEENFIVSSKIAEFFNTITNAPFIILPPILIYLFRSYTAKVGIQANVIFILLLFVGIGSIYFHSTLSLVGQLIDQLMILWVLIIGLGLFFPREYMPRCFGNNRAFFAKVVIAPTLIAVTAATFIKPEINAFILMCFAAPIITILIQGYRSNETWRVRSLAIRGSGEWFFAAILWINDKTLCELVWYYFPYLHAAFHLLIFISAYHAFVVICYFDLAKEYPNLKGELRYWPKDGGYWDLVCLPYVSVTTRDTSMPLLLDGNNVTVLAGPSAPCSHTAKVNARALHAPGATQGALHTTGVTTGASHTTETAAVGLHTTEATTGALHTTEATTGALHTTGVTTGALHTTEATTGALHTTEATTGALHTTEATTGALHTTEAVPGALNTAI